MYREWFAETRGQQRQRKPENVPHSPHRYPHRYDRRHRNKPRSPQNHPERLQHRTKPRNGDRYRRSSKANSYANNAGSRLQQQGLNPARQVHGMREAVSPRPEDPDFSRKNRILFKLIKATHHLQNVSISSPPAFIAKMSANLAAMINPSGPTPATELLIQGNAHNWAVTTMMILRDHYTDGILNDLQILSHFEGHLKLNFEIASKWAKKQLGRRLSQSTLDRVWTEVLTASGTPDSGYDLLQQQQHPQQIENYTSESDTLGSPVIAPQQQQGDSPPPVIHSPPRKILFLKPHMEVKRDTLGSPVIAPQQQQGDSPPPVIHSPPRKILFLKTHMEVKRDTSGSPVIAPQQQQGDSPSPGIPHSPPRKILSLRPHTEAEDGESVVELKAEPSPPLDTSSLTFKSRSPLPRRRRVISLKWQKCPMDPVAGLFTAQSRRLERLQTRQPGTAVFAGRN